MSSRPSRWDTFAPPPPPPPPLQTNTLIEPMTIFSSAPTARSSNAGVVPGLPSLYFTADVPHHHRESIIAAIRQLPEESITAQFSRNYCLRGLVHGGMRTEAMVYKTWHQQPNVHFTVELYWVNEHGDRLAGGGYGGAHVHVNGLETIREFKTANMLRRGPGSTVWETYPPTYNIPVPESNRTPPWRKTDSSRVGRESEASASDLPPVSPRLLAFETTGTILEPPEDLLVLEESPKLQEEEMAEGDLYVEGLVCKPWMAK